MRWESGCGLIALRKNSRFTGLANGGCPKIVGCIQDGCFGCGLLALEERWVGR
jgi:hypothetical protein